MSALMDFIRNKRVDFEKHKNYLSLKKITDELSKLLLSNKEFIETYKPNTTPSDIDIVIDSYFKLFINGEDLPIFALMYVLIVFPFVFNMLYYKKTKEQVKEFVKELKSAYIEIYGNQSNSDFLNEIDNINAYLSQDFTKTSALFQFNYLYGSEFHIETCHKLINEMMNNNLLIIHGSYNNSKQESLIKYNSPKQYPFFLLKSGDISKYLLYTKYESKLNPKTPYTIIKNNSERWDVVISYDDNEDIKNCHGSMAFTKLKQNEIDILLGGGTLGQIPKSQLELYFVERYYERTGDKPKSEENPEIITDIILNCYDENTEKTINNVFDYIEKNNINDKYFKIYMSLLRESNPTQHLDKMEFIEFLNGYF